MAPAAFRFVFVYLLLFYLPFPLGCDPFTEAIVEAWSPWNHIVPWVGEHVLGLGDDMIVMPTGSGDRTFDWVAMLCKLVLAALAAAVWCAIDRDRRHDVELSLGLRVYVRYVLAYTMLAYGFHKVFVLQMQFPSSGRLLTPLGELSPMGLLWSFMGYSPGYTMFTGFAEVVGGALLMSRRTTTLGALVTVAVMSNVVMLNLCYDVPLKINSIHLVLLGVLLLVPDARRLAGVFFSDGSTAPPRRWWRAPLTKAVVVLGMVCLTFGVNLAMWLTDETCDDPLCGAYDVETFVQNGVEVAPGTGQDAKRWHRIVVGDGGRFTALLIDGTRIHHRMQRAEDGRTLVLSRPRDDGGGTLTELTEAGRVRLTGTIDGASLDLELRRVDTAALPLVARGFHWVNEFPYNL